MLIAIKGKKGEWEDHLFRIDEFLVDTWTGFTQTPYDGIGEGYDQEYGEFYYLETESHFITDPDVNEILLRAGIFSFPVEVPTAEEREVVERDFLLPYGLIDEEGEINDKGKKWAHAISLHEERTRLCLT